MLSKNTLNPLHETSVYAPSTVENLIEGKKWLMNHSVSNKQLNVNEILGREKKRRQCCLSTKYRPGQRTGNNLVVILQDKR